MLVDPFFCSRFGRWGSWELDPYGYVIGPVVAIHGDLFFFRVGEGGRGESMGREEEGVLSKEMSEGEMIGELAEESGCKKMRRGRLSVHY